MCIDNNEIDALREELKDIEDAKTCAKKIVWQFMRRGIPEGELNVLIDSQILMGRTGDFKRQTWRSVKRFNGLMNTVDDASEWLSMPDTPDNPIIEGLIEQGESVAVVGSSKAGKSFLALQMAVCIAAGVPFLGRKTCRRGVLVDNLEVSEVQYKRRLRRMTDAMGVSWEQFRGTLFTNNRKNLDTTWEDAGDTAEFLGAEVIVIDPFYQIYEGSEIDEKEIKVAIEQMKSLQKRGFTLIVVFHAPKGYNGDRNLIDMISGSSRLARYPESILGLLNHANREDRNLRVFSTILRNCPPMDDETLRLEDGAFFPVADIAPVVETAASRKQNEGTAGANAVKSDAEYSKLEKALNSIMDGPLIGKTTLHQELKRMTCVAKHTVEDFIKEKMEKGELTTCAEMVMGADGRPVTKNRNQGGKVFISTPAKIQQYKETFKG